MDSLKAYARLADIKVLPTPPLPLAIAITTGIIALLLLQQLPFQMQSQEFLQISLQK